jgi:hypothetical protein
MSTSLQCPTHGSTMQCIRWVTRAGAQRQAIVCSYHGKSGKGKKCSYAVEATPEAFAKHCSLVPTFTAVGS